MSNSRSQFSLCGENYVCSLGGVPTLAQGGIMLFQGHCFYYDLVHGLVPKKQEGQKKKHPSTIILWGRWLGKGNLITAIKIKSYQT